MIALILWIYVGISSANVNQARQQVASLPVGTSVQGDTLRVAIDRWETVEVFYVGRFGAPVVRLTSEKDMVDFDLPKGVKQIGFGGEFFITPRK